MSRLKKNKQYLDDTKTVEFVKEEVDRGLGLLNKIEENIITFFGGHMVEKGSEYYEHCKKLAYELGKKKYAILSGGGPGIMHAANSGATDAGATSVGMQAELLKGERVEDDVFTDVLSFHYLFVRRFLMSIKSEALIFYPGGFGTLNELFEYAMLMQVGITDKVPIICVNKKFWEGMFDWLRDNPMKEEFLINDADDLELLYFVDDVDEIINIIEK